MKISDTWVYTLCALLAVASVIGWSLPLRIAVVANALVVLIGIVRRLWAHFKGSKEA